MIYLSLSGCWDQREIEKRAYVYAIGMDKAEEENKFTITYLIVNPEYGTNGNRWRANATILMKLLVLRQMI